MINAVSDNGVYSNGSDAIKNQDRRAFWRWACLSSLIEKSLRNGSGGGSACSDAQKPALWITPDHVGRCADGSSVMAVAAHEHATLAGFGIGVVGSDVWLGSPRLVGCRTGSLLVVL